MNEHKPYITELTTRFGPHQAERIKRVPQNTVVSWKSEV